MTERTFHLETIRGLIRHTTNRTHLDLEQRGLTAIGTIVDWTNLRTFNNEINSLFRSAVRSHREQIAVNNLIVETRRRTAHFATAIANLAEYEEAIADGIKAYSRYIKENHYRPARNFRGFFQSIEEQFYFGILETF